MPRIPTYNGRVAAQGRLNVRKAQASDYGGGLLIQAGKELGDFAEKLQAKKDKRDAVEIERHLVDEQSKLLQWEKQLQTSAQAGAPNHLDNVSTELNSRADTMRENFKGVSEDNKQRLTLGIARLRSTISGRAFSFQTMAEAKKVRDDVTTSLEDLQNMVRDDPTTLDAALKQGEAVVDAAAMYVGDKTALKKELQSNLVEERYNSQIGDAMLPEEILELKDDLSRDQKRLDPKSFARLQDGMDRAYKTLRREEQNRFETEFKERMKLLASGREVGTYSEKDIYDKIIDPDTAQEMVELQQRVEQEGAVMASLKTQPVEDIAQNFKALEAKADNPNLDPTERVYAVEQLSRYEQAFSRRQREINADPVKYVTEFYPGARKLHVEMMDAVAEANGNPNDPAAQDIADVAVNRYASRMVTIQQDLGTSRPRLLSSQEVQNIGQFVSQVERTEDGADNLRTTLQGQANRWRGAWPSVYRQLVAEKAITGGHVVLARLAGDPSKNTATWHLARALNYTQDEMLKGVVEPADVKDAIGAGVTSAMEEFAPTLYAQGNVEAVNRIQQTAGQLAAWYVTQEGMDPEDAGSRAAEELATSDYAIFDRMRVPRTYDTEAVEKGQQVKSIIGDKYKLDLPISFATGTMDYEDYSKSVAENGYFITNSDETGVILVGPHGRAVTHSDGVPVSMTFEELARNGDDTYFRDQLVDINKKRKSEGKGAVLEQLERRRSPLMSRPPRTPEQ